MGVEVNAVLIRIAEIGLDGPAHAVEVLHAAIDDEAASQPLALNHAVQHRRSRIDAGLELLKGCAEREAPTAEAVLAGRDQAQSFVQRRALRFTDHEIAVRIDEK